MECLFASYVYYTDIMQAETLASAYRLWRRNWRGNGREYTAGALVWQVCMFRAITCLKN
jgi:beta-mannosidase